MAKPVRLNLQLFLDRLKMRSILTAEEQSAVLDLPGKAEQVQPNHDFVELGEHVDHACLMIAGLAGRFHDNGDGVRQITAVHIPGDMCDLHSVVEPTATSALQSLSVATILRVPHSAIRSVAAQYPAVAEALWRDCVVDAGILCEWVINVGRRTATMRIAHLLCEMANRLGAAAEGLDDIVLDLPITQSQLADATALTPIHVNRTLQSLRASGLVEWRQRVVRLPRLKALARAGDFDPSYLVLGQVPPDQRFRIASVH